jgi:hypothetical protein
VCFTPTRKPPVAAFPGTLLDADDGAFGSAERDGVVLKRNPVLEFNGENVTFRQLGIGSDELTGFEAVRSFNVLFYFDDAFRRKTLHWMADVLVDGGIFVCGVNATYSGSERYAVYRAENGALVPSEFAFSIENVRPLDAISIFALQDDDRDRALMASLIGIVRSDAPFRDAFDARMDKLVAEYGLGARLPNGYLGPVTGVTEPKQYLDAAQTIGRTLFREGFNERAAQVLRAHGYSAWVNCVGHVAIDPVSIPRP